MFLEFLGCFWCSFRAFVFFLRFLGCFGCFYGVCMVGFLGSSRGFWGTFGAF